MERTAYPTIDNSLRILNKMTVIIDYDVVLACLGHQTVV